MDEQKPMEFKHYFFEMLNDSEKIFSFFVLTTFNSLSFIAAFAELIKGFWVGRMVMVTIQNSPIEQIPLYLFIQVVSVVASIVLIFFNKLILGIFRWFGK